MSDGDGELEPGEIPDGAGSVITDSVGDSLDWVWQLKPLTGFVGLLTRFGRNPKQFVLGFLLDWALDGTLDIVAMFVDGILAAWGVVAGIPWLLVSSIRGVIRPPFQMTIGLLGTLGDLLAGLAGVAGPGGPVVWALFAVAAYWFITDAVPASASAIPVVGPFIELGVSAAGALNPFNLLGGKS